MIAKYAYDRKKLGPKYNNLDGKIWKIYQDSRNCHDYKNLKVKEQMGILPSLFLI